MNKEGTDVGVGSGVEENSKTCPSSLFETSLLFVKMEYFRQNITSFKYRWSGSREAKGGTSVPEDAT